MKIFSSYRLITKIASILLALLAFSFLFWEAGKFSQLFFSRWLPATNQDIIGTMITGMGFVLDVFFLLAVIVIFVASFFYQVIEFFSPQLAKRIVSLAENQKAPK